MIKEIRYKNFKALRDTTLPLGRFTLIVGANGTGKTTTMNALKIINNLDNDNFEKFLTSGLLIEKENLQIEVFWKNFSYRRTVSLKETTMNHLFDENQNNLGGSKGSFTNTLKETYRHESEGEAIKSFKLFRFEPDKTAAAVSIQPNIELKEDGGGLSGVLDQLRDTHPEKFEELNRELNTWFYEYDRILFEIPENGKKAFLLRTTIGKNIIKANDLSHGTLLALAYLTLAYLPNPLQIVAFEEPERGIHPRLLRNIQEAMDRLAYPENYGEKREPVQVIATTHSPYLLDLYKDRREEIVIADKDENGVHFERLTDLPNIEKILQEQDAPLGDVWFSGILGGVPAQL